MHQFSGMICATVTKFFDISTKILIAIFLRKL